MLCKKHFERFYKKILFSGPSAPVKDLIGFNRCGLALVLKGLVFPQWKKRILAVIGSRLFLYPGEYNISTYEIVVNSKFIADVKNTSRDKVWLMLGQVCRLAITCFQTGWTSKHVFNSFPSTRAIFYLVSMGYSISMKRTCLRVNKTLQLQRKNKLSGISSSAGERTVISYLE